MLSDQAFGIAVSIPVLFKVFEAYSLEQWLLLLKHKTFPTKILFYVNILYHFVGKHFIHTLRIGIVSLKRVAVINFFL